ncbi:TetR/AcrR family transcriptional regulator [Amycolatopsis sp. ATCC 39116]|uniref:TetR/AcrR family transcriptional regulator n=1 Tax=Amycolatopsis sp. (strain ATCC 39116 / 75iv2) TaxID=385957 RepID=UPI00048855CE|nr:TetR family transcriptional regulator [Amycolatopsis sp. ATCC 39116]
MENGTTRRPGRGARERVLAAANRLFATQGINATSMEDVAAQAPVSKRTLYAHFPTKDDLVLAQLRALVESGDTLHAVLTREDIPPRDRLLAMFDIPAPATGPVRGCPFLDAAAEFPDPDSAAHAYARAQKLLMLRLVTDLVIELGVAEPELLAEQLVTLADGAAIRAMTLNDAGSGRHARAAAATLIDHAERNPTE